MSSGVKTAFDWHRLTTGSGPLFDNFLEILKGIEPNTPPVSGLVTCDPVNYRIYIACHSDQVGAIAIACYLPKCKVLHIEDFALNPNIYGKGVATHLFDSWLEFVAAEWPEARDACSSRSLMIEVYLQNIEPWRKIMGVEKVKTSLAAIFIRDDTPIVLMAKNLPCHPDIAYKAWQVYQQEFYTRVIKKKHVDDNVKNIINYCSGMIGKPYVWSRGVPFSGRNIGPIWSYDGPPPKDIDITNCAGLINLGLRSIGLTLPVSRDGITKGGTLAYQEYYENVAEPFDIKKIYPVGTLIGRRYNKTNKDQGHLAIVIENNFVLQSCHPDGVNNTYTIHKANETEDGSDYYHYAVKPEKWLVKETSRSVKRLEKILGHVSESYSGPDCKSGKLGSSGKRTGIIWDERFLLYNAGVITSGQFPAKILPTKGIYVQAGEHFDKDTLSRSHSLVQVTGAGDELHSIKPRYASIEELQYVHDLEYIKQIEAMNEKGGDAGEFTTFGAGGGDIAKLAVGGVIEAVDAVATGVVKNCYALIKPCGHHANKNRGIGFCIYNCIAIGAKYGQKKYGYRRVCILDFDGQHGNGTQQAFWGDDSVLYISTHQDNLYPSGSGTIDQTGEGKGRGYTINVPLPPGTGEGGFDEAWKRVIIPAIDAFGPDIIMVSAGYNCTAMDPMSRLMLSSGALVVFTENLMKLADKHCSGRLVFVHEGGYSQATTPFCVLSVIETLMERKTKTLDPYREEIQNYGGQKCTKEQSDVIDAVINHHTAIVKNPLLLPRNRL